MRPFNCQSAAFALPDGSKLGVQLNDGSIMLDQFLTLNEAIGGYDGDGNYTSARSSASPATIARAYQSGLQLGANGGLAAIPVFDLSNFYDEDNFYHYQWFHFAVRERLLQANGDTRNHVMWRGGVSFPDLFGQLTPGKAERAAVNAKAQADAWPLFVQWVARYKATPDKGRQRDRVIASKPAGAVDGCFTLSTAPQFIAEAQSAGHTGTPGTCNAIWPTWSFPRAQSGASIASDKLKCQLKPVSAADYTVSVDVQALARLKAAFPEGVCDWRRQGVGQRKVLAYPSVGPAPANRLFDMGTP